MAMALFSQISSDFMKALMLARGPQSCGLLSIHCSPESLYFKNTLVVVLQVAPQYPPLAAALC